ncbi:MAG: nuclear transport factor 2 family protein [Alphaproteobacteria bacterium]|nr:nuclear transport factor 2 family protein [Alphaproteobacteria bacterium]
MTEPAAAIHALIDEFATMIRTRNPALLDRLWGEGGFTLIGSEVGEICRTRPALQAKIAAIFANPATLAFDFPARDITFAGPIAWAFVEGMLARHEPDGGVTRRVYLASCIFEHTQAGWRWRQFFGSEPY